MRSFCYFLLAWFGSETPILPTFADKVLLHLPALEYDSNLEIDQDVYQMACVEGPPEDMNPMAPDAQTTESDEECRALGNCHISDTLPGESVSYLFFPNELDLEEYYQFVESEDGVIIVDITVRVAAGENATRAIDLQVFDSHGHDVAGPKEFVVNGRGYQDFYDITWNGVQLETSKFYEIYVVFTEGRVNMCSIKVTLSQTEVGAVSIPVKVGSANDTVQAPLPSITWSALEYSLHDGIEVAVPPGQLDGRNSICQLRKDGVHAQSNNDRICRERDESPCSIAFTEPSEFLSYRFEVPQESDGKFDFRVRAAAASGGKMISFELRNATAEVEDTFFGKRFELPHGDGSWDQYHDIHWRAPPLAYGEYFLDIRFLTGHVNLCSTSVMISDTSSTALDNPMEVPGLYSALNYFASNDTTPEFNEGDCTNTPLGGVDTQETSDPICTEAISLSQSNVTCTIAFTEAEESMTYHFKTDPTRTMMNFSFRMASQDSHRRFLVEIDASDGETSKVLFAPGRGFHVYESVSWEEVEVKPSEQHELKVTFLDGKINLCAIEARYTEGINSRQENDRFLP